MKVWADGSPFTSRDHPISPGYFGGRTLRATLRPHGSGDWLLICTLAGSGLHRFRGGEVETRPHDITLYRPGSFQNYQWSPKAGRWDILYAHFLPREEWLPWLNWPERGEGLMLLHLDDSGLRRQVVRSLREMVRHSQGPQRRRYIFSLHALEEALLWCDTANPQQETPRIDPRVGKVMDFLCQHLAVPYSEANLAQVAGLSASRLRHLFRLQTGQSIRDFQERQRMERGRQLLALSTQTIGEIASQVGFTNPFYFTLRFKKYSGESPRAFRQRITK